MSWSVSAIGKVVDVQKELKRQFAYPLGCFGEGNTGLADDGEKETVRQVAAMIEQCLGTFDPEKSVSVSAYGHMGFSHWNTKTGAFQNVNVAIA